MPPEVRRCACGCGHPVLDRLGRPTRNQAHRYVAIYVGSTIVASHRPPKMGSTKAGRGWGYQQARKTLMAQPPNGRPCPKCGRPMTNEQWQANLLHSGHKVDLMFVDRTRKITVNDLQQEHGACNMRAGAALGNRLRAGTLTQRRPAW